MIRVLVPLLALAACAATPGAPPPVPPTPVAIEADSIRYASGPCFGTCPVYTVIVSPDGSGVFVGERNTAVAGERSFRVTRAQYDAFAAKLAPHRPTTGTRDVTMGSQECGVAPTDMPSANVTWTRAIGDAQVLNFYFGCARANAALAADLRDAPALLPVADFIGRR